MCSTQPGGQLASARQDKQDGSSASVPSKTQTAAVSYSSSEVTPREQERSSPRQSRYEILKYGDDSDDDRMIICEDKDSSTIGMTASMFSQLMFLPSRVFRSFQSDFTKNQTCDFFVSIVKQHELCRFNFSRHVPKSVCTSCWWFIAL